MAKRTVATKKPRRPSQSALDEAVMQCGYSTDAVSYVMHVIMQPDEPSAASADGKAAVGGASAQAICRKIIGFAAANYHDRALDAMEHWNLITSEDVGRIVNALVSVGAVAAGEGESEADFSGVFDYEELVRSLSGIEPAAMEIARNSDGQGGAAPRVASRQRLVPKLMEEHFHPHSVQSLTITERKWPSRVRVDLQRALEQVFSGPVKVLHFSGVRREHSHEGLTMHDLVTYSRHENAQVVPPHYDEVDIGDEAPVRCLSIGLWLAEHDGVRFAVLMTPGGYMERKALIHFHVAAVDGDEGSSIAGSFHRHLEKAVAEARSYRGKVLSLEQEDRYSGKSSGITVHKMRQVDRSEVILPARTLKLLERNVIQFVQRRQRLSALGMQTKKGLLFYGPPGTGKTHTIHYLAGALPDHTTLLIAAEQVGLLPEYMTLARLLQPSIVVIEDADLIARERRSMNSVCEEVMLNKLLNEMDGLKEQADILFILTTNRPEMLEPALAARPGRIDQAIEFPVPDDDGRRKLVRLYARGLSLDDSLVASIVQRCDGVSAAFIKELMRRAAQFQDERSGGGAATSADIDAALEEMLFVGGALNRKLLGGAVEPA